MEDGRDWAYNTMLIDAEKKFSPTGAYISPKIDFSQDYRTLQEIIDDGDEELLEDNSHKMKRDKVLPLNGFF